MDEDKRRIKNEGKNREPGRNKYVRERWYDLVISKRKWKEPAMPPTLSALSAEHIPQETWSALELASENPMIFEISPNKSKYSCCYIVAMELYS